MKTSIREIGASGGAADVVLCAYMLVAPMPTVHPTSSIPLNLLKNREACVYPPQPFLEVTQKNLRLMENKPGKTNEF